MLNQWLVCQPSAKEKLGAEVTHCWLIRGNYYYQWRRLLDDCWFDPGPLHKRQVLKSALHSFYWKHLEEARPSASKMFQRYPFRLWNLLKCSYHSLGRWRLVLWRRTRRHRGAPSYASFFSSHPPRACDSVARRSDSSKGRLHRVLQRQCLWSMQATDYHQCRRSDLRSSSHRIHICLSCFVNLNCYRRVWALASPY